MTDARRLDMPPLPRAARMPGWPRLMAEQMAADYLSIGTSTLRKSGPAPLKLRGRTVWDIRDLDRFADQLAGRPIDDGDDQSHASDVERQWFEDRRKQGHPDR